MVVLVTKVVSKVYAEGWKQGEIFLNGLEVVDHITRWLFWLLRWYVRCMLRVGNRERYF
jgi:hypothetical protein